MIVHGRRKSQVKVHTLPTIITFLAFLSAHGQAQNSQDTQTCSPSLSSSSTAMTPPSKSAPACLGLGEESRPHQKASRQMSHQAESRPSSPRGSVNVLNTPLKLCCSDPVTGYERDGFCHTGTYDRGKHTVCAVMTAAFLNYTQSKGNDLSTPLPQYGFPGLKPGDRWCLCALRWAEAERAGFAPPIDLEATHAKTLEYIPIETLKTYRLVKK